MEARVASLAGAMANSIKVAMDLSKGLMVQAKGPPAQVVSYAAAAAVVFVGVSLGLGAYQGAKALVSGAKKLGSPKPT